MYSGFTKNYAETAEVTTYGAIDSPSTPRWSVGGYHRMKEMMLNEDWEILTTCGGTEALDGQDGPSYTSVIINRK
ncbi:hypothetical protein EJD97_007407 [Solanum chilense]|uniref:Uncharacterized protein n=1 Tax=Solanum chilense TaxID=4083 RepID=A0A6N2BNU0_SOLCI|nr:hypothetical protein EJD97_007407 [Solanum chilense]